MAKYNVSLVSLGCPKNLVDSERILTQLRAEGYEISPDFAGADLVIVNTCGFIDDAVEESLETIGEALEENGRVIVTGCLGVREDEIRETHPAVLAVMGPHAYEEVMEHVHEHLPAPHDPFLSLLPPSGVKLTPKHYAYLKISEGCNHRCSFCIIPQMRGDLVSRPFAEVMHEAENLVASGVRELLVVSQDTSAYGVDTRYRPDFWKGRPVQTRIRALARELGHLEAWIRLHYVYPYPHVDDLVPLMAEGDILPYLDMPLQHGSQRILNGKPRRPHFGVDVEGPVGAPVVAPAGGVVTLAHPDMYFSGGTLVLDHGHGLSSAFLHLSRILVEEGQRVEQGDPIAEIGATGRVTGAHLDWRMNWFEQRIDPQLLAGPMPATTETLAERR